MNQLHHALRFRASDAPVRSAIRRALLASAFAVLPLFGSAAENARSELYAALRSTPKVIARLAGQHYEYVGRQTYDAVEGRRPNMSDADVRMFARLDRDDIVGLADFLSRLGSLPEANAHKAVASTR